MSTQAPGVTVGNAAKVAVELTQAALGLGITPGEFLGHYENALDGVLALMTDRTAPEQTFSPTPPPSSVAATVARVQDAFPGTTAVTPSSVAPAVVAPPSAVPAAVVPAAFPATGPAAIPGVTGGDAQLEEAWNVFFNDINAGTWVDNWEDNRNLKKQGGKFAKIPDFKHKSWQRPGDKYPVGLYIDDKKNPAWVAQALAGVGIQ